MDKLNSFQNWEIDQKFISAVIENHSIELVSLDIFDTALTRLVDSPADAFALMERRLATEIGAKARHFAIARENAERFARIKHFEAYGQEEISLDAIYAAFHPAFTPHMTRAREIELEVERDLLVAVPDVLLLTHRLKEAGRPFIFVSDMYLPNEFLAEILSQCGYAGWEALYVSAAVRATKRSGRIWNSIAARYSQLEKILHIGDNEWADGKQPKQYGIHTILFERVRTERRVGAKLNPDLLPFSFLQRHVVLTSHTVPNVQPDVEAKWRELGCVLGGITLAGFLLWLKKKVEQHSIERLYFCARDGWLVQRAWHAAGLNKITGVDDRYLYISRRPLNLACGYVESHPTQLSFALVEFLTHTDTKTTVRTMLNRAKLIGNTSVEADLIQHYGSLDIQLDWQNLTSMANILRKYSSRIYANLRQDFEVLTGYLEQEQVGINARCAIVDMGWHATIQRSLTTVLKQMSGTRAINGFYYGLWTQAAGNRLGAGMMESAFASKFIRIEDQAEVWCAAEILEELHMAPHGTVVSYEWRDSKWTPMIAESPIEMSQYQHLTRHFQEGALEAVASLFATGRYGPIQLDEITPSVVRAALGAICISPSARELSLLGSIRHCSTFDHSHADAIIPAELPSDEQTMQSIYARSGWRLGTVLSWQKHASPKQKELIKAFARDKFCYLSERVLRQFY